MERTDEREVRMLTAVLRQEEANRRAVFEWAHPSWFSDALPRDIGVATDAAPLKACAARWLELLGVGPVPMRAFCGHAASLAALPIETMMKMLRLRAVWPRRAQLRHWIDRPRRLRLAESVGAAAADALRKESASMLGAPAWVERAPALDTSSDEALAWDGYCLFVRDGVWPGPDDGTPPLARMALPRDGAVAEWIGRYRPGADGGDSEAVLNYLPLVSTEDQ